MRLGEADACSDAYDPTVSMLGARQERWLDRGLRQSTARWNLMGSNVMMAPLRGYVRGRLTPDRFIADLQMVRTVSRRDAERYTYASFEVEDGVPGAHRI